MQSNNNEEGAGRVSAILFFDGSSVPVNPNGNIGASFVVYEAIDFEVIGPGERHAFTRCKSSKKIHSNSCHHTFGEKGFESTSNNQAEHLALNIALQWLSHKDYYSVFIFGDSQLVINQMTGKFKISRGKTYSDYGFANKKLFDHLNKKINELNIYWIPREFNVPADELSKR